MKLQVYFLMFLLLIVSVSAGLTDSLEAYYNFEDGSGSTLTDYEGSNDGTLVNTPTWTGASKLGSWALDFDAGSSEFVDLTSNLGNDAAFTINCWISPVSTNPVQYEIFTRYDGSTVDYILQLYNDEIWFQVAGASQARKTIAGATSWSMVTATANSTDVLVYVNASVGSAGGTAAHSSTGVAQIGARKNTGEEIFFNGKIDECAYWSRVLNTTEISQLYNSGAGLARTSFGAGAGQVNFTMNASNAWNITGITSFNITMRSESGSRRTYSTTDGVLESDIAVNDPDKWTIDVDAEGYVRRKYPLYNISNNLEAELANAWVNIKAKNTATDSFVSVFNVTDNNQTRTYQTSTGTLIMPATQGQISYTGITTGNFPNTDFVITHASLTNSTFIYNSTPNYQFNFIDERLEVPFNMNSFDTMTVQVYCDTETLLYNLNSTSQNFSTQITCDFSKVRFTLEYGTEIYYRTLLIDETGTNQNVYLLNLLNSTSVFNTFVAYDLLGEYTNKRILLYKRIQNETVQITGDYVDAENKIGAYLLLGSEYTIEILSDNKATYNLGSYFADSAGTKTIRLFDVDLGTTTVDFDGSLSFWAYLINDSGTYRIRAQFNDSTATTTNTKFTIYNGSLEVYSTSSASPNILYTYTIPAGAERTVYSMELNVTNSEYGNRRYTKTFVALQQINTPAEFKSNKTLPFILLGLLVIISLIFTISSANLGTIIVGAAAILFSVIGWLPIWNTAIGGFILFIGLIQMYREGET